MSITNINQYDVNITKKNCRCIAVNGIPTNHFVAPDTRRGINKLYMLKSNQEICYVGITRQPMSSRLWIGYQTNSRTGYSGYKWRSKITEGKLLVWCFSDTEDNGEAIEGELVYLIRNKTGKWPSYQMEIHFHPDATEKEKQIADLIFNDALKY